jgi:hypothetical protein
VPITRQFLGWKQPVLRSAAEFLLAQQPKPGTADLRQVIVVIPGRRAGRRLLEILVQEAARQKLTLLPPEIITEGELPEKLYTPKLPFADQLTQDLVWARVLQAAPDEVRQKIVPRAPSAEDATRWLELGRLIRKQHTELAADGLDFSHVATRGAKLAGFDGVEQARWQALRTVQEAYLRQLDALELWDKQTARLYAIEHKEPRTEQRIFLLGMVDLNVAIRRMLDQVASQVTAFIAAPAEAASDFDKHGCLKIESWLERSLPIDDSHLCRVDGPADQAEEVARQISGYQGRYRADEITIGVPDETLVPQLQRQLEQCGVVSRWVEGKALRETGPYRLLEALAAYADGRRFAPFAALVRHPELHTWLHQVIGPATGKSLVAAIDEYCANFLPTHIGDDWLGKPEEHKTIKAVSDALDKLLAGSDRAKLLREWAPLLQTILQTVYEATELDRSRLADRAAIRCLERLVDSLSALTEVPDKVQPMVSFAQAIRLALEPLSAESVPQATVEEAVEILGWLELALDDAPALVVTTFNEGFVPKAATSDAFLPNRLRQHLGLLDNDRRYARDAYATQVLLASRQKLALIVARRDPEKNPLLPSRLLFAADDDTVARRALSLFQRLPPAAPRRPMLAAVAPSAAQSAFFVPLPEKQPEPPAYFTVTQFKTYIACPFRFYLSHVLRLAQVTDDARELDGAAFGNLLHDVLQRFGKADAALQTSTNPDELFKYLEAELASRAGQCLGAKRRAGAVTLQLEHARLRLKALAQWQAQRNQEGWQLVYAEEFESQLEVNFAVEGGSALLKGRIDRIDWNEATRTLQVLDYKTSDTANDPAKVHRLRDGTWCDLQLPLYRRLLDAKNLKLPYRKAAQRLEFGYINLPKSLPDVGHKIAGWNETDLDSADAEARRIIGLIRDQQFWPPKDKPPSFSDAWAAICQDRLQARRLAPTN